MDGAVGHGAVESGNHRAVAQDHLALQGFIGFLLIDGAVHIEFHPVRGVNELEAQVVRHQLGGQVLAPADQLLLGDLLGIDAVLEQLQVHLNGQGQAQLIPDVDVAVGNGIKNGGAVHTVLDMGIAQVQQVRQLVVAAVSLAGGRNHHHLTLGVRHQDIPHLAVLTGIRHGAAAEFHYFHWSFLSI